MRFSNNVVFYPWIGNNYANTKPMIMILGESLWHDNGHPDEYRVSAYIMDQINYGEKISFFDTIQDIYRMPYHTSNQEFWHDVCFYEYVQEFVPSSDDRPTPRQWLQAQEPFKEVVRKLKPDVIIAMGSETYGHLPDEGRDGDTISDEEGNRLVTCIYNWCGKETMVLRTHHPSYRYFDPSVWRKLWQAFVNRYY